MSVPDKAPDEVCRSFVKEQSSFKYLTMREERLSKQSVAWQSSCICSKDMKTLTFKTSSTGLGSFKKGCFSRIGYAARFCVCGFGRSKVIMTVWSEICIHSMHFETMRMSDADHFLHQLLL
ncbi:hypothetical protein PoB_005376200 [Plakobranchus ocellatus]|uniref:Uncharacterized protein n=1 Tax=Plakobranchus ocellatus TaxID=259542 RepID=A0AAV4C7J6_9GAST|nr:hypothetical protein PoB_005376200 [Plakobranchus ocellatus]